jgi:hypothetical protein
VDFITSFVAFTGGFPSPELFRRWTAIAGLAAALERRVWARVSGLQLYPNLYCLLVAPPGVGKTVALDPLRDLWRGTKKLYVAPNSTTKASLLDQIEKAKRALPLNGGKELFECHSLAVGASEFGVFIPAYDNEFLSVLNDIYDNPPVFQETRRVAKSVDIPFPQLNIIAGVQPGYLANILPEEAWTMGFMSRMLMIYSETGPQVELQLDAAEPSQEELAARQRVRSALQGDMNMVCELMGPVSWEPEAARELSAWHRQGMPPAPEHSKLEHYIRRRVLFAVKLCIVSAASRGELIIRLGDLTRVKDWLLEAESLMPDVFRAMVQRSDGQVIQDLHYYMWKIWLPKKKPCHESMLYHFLKTRVPSEKIPRIIETAVRSRTIQELGDGPGGKLYIPRPHSDHGVE